MNWPLELNWHSGGHPCTEITSNSNILAFWKHGIKRTQKIMPVVRVCLQHQDVEKTSVWFCRHRLIFRWHFLCYFSVSPYTKEQVDIPELTGCRWSYAIKHCRPSSANNKTWGIKVDDFAAKPQRRASKDIGTWHLGEVKLLRSRWRLW